MADAVTIKAVGPVCTISEGPHWQQELGALVYVDIIPGHIHRYFPATKRHQQLKVEPGKTGASVSFVVPVEGRPEILLIGLGQEVAAVKWPVESPDSSSAKAVVFSAVDGSKATRFNDAKCDPQGRLWAGTMGLETAPAVLPPNLGALYRFDSKLNPTSCVDKVTLSNGLAWSLERKEFYYIDTNTLQVDAFDYEDTTGEIKNRRVLLAYRSEGYKEDLPDGMAIDTSGNIWVASYMGHKILCIDPHDKKVIRTIQMPVRNITSVCFAGADYSTLYVTTGRPGLTEEQEKLYPNSGSLFEITGLGVKGLPSVNAKVEESIIQQLE